MPKFGSSPQIENGWKYGITNGSRQLIHFDECISLLGRACGARASCPPYTGETPTLLSPNSNAPILTTEAANAIVMGQIIHWRMKPFMLTVSPRILKALAAAIWHIGGLVLLLKARSLLLEAESINAAKIWPWLAVGTAVLLGGLKARYLFVKSCRKNMMRIDGLERPYLWQFYRPGFFAALTLMIATGATLSRLAHGSYPFLIGVALLDLSIAVALLGSSYVFWQNLGRFTAVSTLSPPVRNDY